MDFKNKEIKKLYEDLKNFYISPEKKEEWIDWCTKADKKVSELIKKANGVDLKKWKI